ncbi:hypothetical protein [Streptomyces sp. FXY-T5]|uniref:hypothetical protein n=1 Tax=Streptomyces sp. FXY-T5 TaxID=3064901 RepID=UPI0027D281B3|nr:hypothetical protein [Streptomyces sp. FXY-T5]WMD08902.1 hypothetical protein Q7C01_33025 [Streptomyces sp. FXY-T5]
MSKRLEFRMQDAQGGVIGLDGLLSLVGDNNWVWSVLDFDGVGNGPSGLTCAEFRDTVGSLPQGYVMSWPQLREFAAGVQQCFDLLLVAASDRRLLKPDRLAVDDFSDCLIALTADDSTWWTVEVISESEVSADLVRSLPRQ